ncbi:MAG: zinc-dependent alcohol dehydrogenase [Gammaproteobacteria bacterium]
MSNQNTILTIPEPGKVVLKEVPYPKIKVGYALVKIVIAPICIEHQIYRDHTFEWHGDEEHMGHEGVGEICEVAEGSKFKLGDRVVIYQGNPCGECFVCQRGLSPTHCLAIPYEEIQGGSNPHEKLNTLNNEIAMHTPGSPGSIEIDCESESGGFGFSKFRIAPENMLQKIPDELPFRYAAAANCTLGCTYTGMEESGVKTGDWVLVAGIGFIGFGAIINAKYRGAKVIALGRNEFRMNLARKIGADHIINPDDPTWLEQIHKLTGYLKGCDHVFECSGYPYYQKKCLQAVRRYGNMFVFGFLVDDDKPLPIHILDELHNRHVSLTGGHDVRVLDREGLINMLMKPEVQEATDHIVTHEFNMSDGKAAFDAALSKKAGKIYLYPWDDCAA